MQQLLLFQDAPEDIRERKIQNLEEKYDKLRKSQHARISSLQKKIDDLEHKLSILESNICKQGLFL